MTSQGLNATKSRRTGKDILQVAKRAGVSPATVSRVTNGRASVDRQLAKRVWKAIEELGYFPNPQARALVSGRSRTLGLLISEITNPFFPELIQSFEDIAGANDFEVMVGSTNYNLERAKIFIRRLVQRRVEGVAVMTFRSEAHLLDELIAQNIPLVSIDESTNAPHSQVLEIDYARGINEAVQHLAILGHRRIGFASGPMPHLTNLRRKEAFEQAARKIRLAAAPPRFSTASTRLKVELKPPSTFCNSRIVLLPSCARTTLWPLAFSRIGREEDRGSKGDFRCRFRRHPLGRVCKSTSLHGADVERRTSSMCL